MKNSKGKLSRITAKKELLDTYKPFAPEIVRNLDEWFRIELTYTSNAIEGNTLSRQETVLVVDEGITVKGKTLREHQEAINHSKAVEFIRQSLVGKTHKELTAQDILEIHKIILDKIEDSAGVYRNVAVRLKGSRTALPNPLKVPELMDEFIEWLNGKNSDHPVKIAADAHYKLVSIHPFIDGNGRTARLLMNLLLMQSGYPPAVIRKEDRLDYIKSLEDAQTGGEINSYYDVIYDAVERSIDVYLETVEPPSDDAMKNVGEFYTTEEVAKILQVDSESVRRYVRSGKLKAAKLSGRLIRIRKSDLNEFIEESSGN